MSAFVETLWREFGIETDEHLGAIESMLVRADHEVIGHQEIAALFRAFHSLKGVSRAMDIRGMEAIAHAVENLLGAVGLKSDARKEVPSPLPQFAPEPQTLGHLKFPVMRIALILQFR